MPRNAGTRQNVILLYLQYGIYDSSAPGLFASVQVDRPLSPSLTIVGNYPEPSARRMPVHRPEVRDWTLQVEASACVLLLSSLCWVVSKAMPVH